MSVIICPARIVSPDLLRPILFGVWRKLRKASQYYIFFRYSSLLGPTYPPSSLYSDTFNLYSSWWQTKPYIYINNKQPYNFHLQDSVEGY
jgi:hypothetical protein